MSGRHGRRSRQTPYRLQIAACCESYQRQVNGGDTFCGSGVRSGAGNALSSLDMASKSRKTHTRTWGFPCSTGKGLLVTAESTSTKETKKLTGWIYR